MGAVTAFLLPLQQWLNATFRRAVLALVAAPVVLVGCIPHSSSNTYYRPAEDMIPSTKVVDFRLAPCETLWTLDDSDAMTNSLYWLRAMDCADRMSDTQARYQAQQIKPTTWDTVFKQSILISGTDPDLQQRRALLTHVNQYRAQMPGAIRPLVQLWRERQTLQVTLGDEKGRNARQQEVVESKFELMTQQQIALQASLADTQRKLKNLTDIERQLSSRKQMQSDIPDNDSSAPSVIKPEETNSPAEKEQNRP